MSTRYNDRDRDRRLRDDDDDRRYAGESQFRGQQFGTGRALYRGGGDYESRDWAGEGEDDRYSSERNRSYGSSGRGGYGGGESSRGYGGGGEYSSGRGSRYGGSEYGGGYGRQQGGRMGTEYGAAYGRGSSGSTGEGYGGTSYGDEYGSSYGAGYERGEGRYRDTTGSQSQRSNYPGGYRSSERYGQGGRSYGEYGGSSYGEGRQYGQGREWYEGQRGYEGRDQYREGEERGWWDRFSDTVASWFGDEDAERRLQRERPYQGRGPKGYRRSDDRIKEDVNDRLSEGYLDATDVEVSVTGGEVVLSGTVNNRYDKRRAEAIAESVSGVSNVENRLRVRDRQQYGSTYGMSEGTTSMGTATTGTMGTTGTTGTTGTAGTTGTTGTETGTSSSTARGKTAGT